ncbi:MAG: ATP phosphoribosyltransferase regulatory subunit [Clostridia bacterium]|nr:ATP phosphoribosyltransferase regulatory subunit [Clostridia bacterium]
MMSAQPNYQPGEAIMFALRSLYDRYGYSRYKMNKFEEYDLYAHNKDFLISDSVITFTDQNGKLMALKPDVTLSIVKNTKDEGGVKKLYYNENVYRVAKGSHSFKEIMQVGLECLGDVDTYCICEVLRLAMKSLALVDENGVFDVSHLGLLTETLDSIGVPAQNRAELLHFIGEKNLHQMTELCRGMNISDEKIDVLRNLVSLHGTAAETMPKLETLLSGYVDERTMEEFRTVITVLNGENAKMLHIDFSVVDDIHYYNGFTFKGFAEGIPASILSGGQYDTLMRKMNRSSGAIGFAVYLDALENFGTRAAYDVDTVLLYDDSTEISVLTAAAAALTQDGSSILVVKEKPAEIRAKKLMQIQNGEVKILEFHA